MDSNETQSKTSSKEHRKDEEESYKKELEERIETPKEKYIRVKQERLDRCLEYVSSPEEISNLEQVLMKAKHLFAIEKEVLNHTVDNKINPGEKYRKLARLDYLLKQREKELKEYIADKYSDEIKGIIEKLDYDNTHLDASYRFRTVIFRNRYDREYSKLKRTFDGLSPRNLSNIDNFRELAESSHQLVEKYKSINDFEGITRSALLHEDIEEAAEKLTPIYESWKKRRITFFVIVLTAAIGFWKGSVIKETVYDLFNIEYQQDN